MLAPFLPALPSSHGMPAIAHRAPARLAASACGRPKNVATPDWMTRSSPALAFGKVMMFLR